LIEKALKTHDIALPLPNGRGTFRVLVLTKSSAQDMASTMTRLEHFAMLDGTSNCALFFLLSDPESYSDSGDSQGTHALEAFQVIQLALLTSPLVLPILCLNGSHAVVPALLAFTNSDVHSNIMVKSSPEVPIAGIHVLPYCSTNAPMDQDTFAAVSDAFQCLRDLAIFRPDSTPGHGNFAGPATAMQCCIEFWERDYLVD
jgi:hypothetical protein